MRPVSDDSNNSRKKAKGEGFIAGSDSGVGGNSIVAPRKVRELTDSSMKRKRFMAYFNSSNTSSSSTSPLTMGSPAN